MWAEPITLEGCTVRLELLGLAHAAGLYAASQSPDIWRYLPHPQPADLGDMQLWITGAINAHAVRGEIPFAIVVRATDRVVGSTRYMNVDEKNRGLEIGWTWLAREVQRTKVNTECKYLLLCHAFETLGAIRVQLKTDSRNEASQRSIEGLGAVKEGVLRNQLIMPDGYYRHSVYYSILDSEWPVVKGNLEAKLNG